MYGDSSDSRILFQNTPASFEEDLSPSWRGCVMEMFSVLLNLCEENPPVNIVVFNSLHKLLK